eukprot:4551611-Alexandrium_andersonii.AAC.1
MASILVEEAESPLAGAQRDFSPNAPPKQNASNSSMPRVSLLSRCGTIRPRPPNLTTGSAGIRTAPSVYTSTCTSLRGVS